MNYLITSARIKGWQVRLADTTIEHARTVFDQLMDDPAVPDDLTLDVDPDNPGATKRSLWRRLLRRG